MDQSLHKEHSKSFLVLTFYDKTIHCINYTLYTLHVRTMRCIPCTYELCAVYPARMNYALYTLHVRTMRCIHCTYELCAVYPACTNYALYTQHVRTMRCIPCMYNLYTVVYKNTVTRLTYFQGNPFQIPFLINRIREHISVL